MLYLWAIAHLAAHISRLDVLPRVRLGMRSVIGLQVKLNYIPVGILLTYSFFFSDLREKLTHVAETLFITNSVLHSSAEYISFPSINSRLFIPVARTRPTDVNV